MVKDLCFEIIDKCPNECKFCSSNSCYQKNTIITFNDFKRVLDYFIKQGGIEELSISGGEPFLHPDLFKMVEYSKSLGIKTVIFTSGIKKRLPVDPDIIQFYKNKMNSDLKQIQEHEPENNRLKNNVKSYYERIINPPEFSGITKYELSKLKELGLDKIVFDYQAYEQDTDEYLMGRDKNKHMCNAGLEKLDIKYDGTILPCPAFKELDLETMKRYGIKYYNIYENLEEIKTPGGKRIEPLCRKIYKN